MKFAIFLIVVVVGLAQVSGLIISMLSPRARIWPPPRKWSWQFWYVWAGFAVVFPGSLIVGLLDWNTLGFAHWSRFLFGGAFIGAAVLIGFWAIRTLSMHQSLGLKGRLVTTGPYAYSRNPQYLSDVLLFAGVILITSSVLALIVGAIIMSWFIVAPFSEEPWLRERLGAQYEHYFQQVSRFVGRRSSSAALTGEATRTGLLGARPPISTAATESTRID